MLNPKIFIYQKGQRRLKKTAPTAPDFNNEFLKKYLKAALIDRQK